MEKMRINVAIYKDVHKEFGATCKRTPVGRSMNDAASRILHWFCQQTDVVKTAVLSDVDRGMETAYADALRRLANDLEGREGDSRPSFVAEQPDHRTVVAGTITPAKAAASHPKTSPGQRPKVAGTPAKTHGTPAGGDGPKAH